MRGRKWRREVNLDGRGGSNPRYAGKKACFIPMNMLANRVTPAMRGRKLHHAHAPMSEKE